MAEFVFILEPDAGRVTVESSQAEPEVTNEIKRYLGQGTALNCARPQQKNEKSAIEFSAAASNVILATNSAATLSDNQRIYLFRLYHHSTTDGPGRRSVVQFAGCSIRCAGCYVPETHERSNGSLIAIDKIVAEVDQRRAEHDGVTILGGEPFDQIESLEMLVTKFKEKNYHLTLYTGHTLEDLLEQNNERINRILINTDLLIDNPFKRELAGSAGEYRGSSNQRLILHPILRRT